jgi:hypothetical protein
MKELNEVTFIVPVFIDSYDRLNNVKTVMGYLNHHFKTNVIVHELVNYETQLPFLSEFTNLNIQHIVQTKKSDTYERTRQLNEMLSMVQTDVVCNYDVDVILPIESYIASVENIVNGSCDVIYPYEVGMWQKKVFQSFDRTEFMKSYDIHSITEFDIFTAEVGHCFFIKTKLYKECGGENEEFLAYAPEDKERYFRFAKFGYTIGRIDGFVYHFEHMRTANSNNANPYMEKNNRLYSHLYNMDLSQLKEYYSNVQYRTKYEF